MGRWVFLLSLSMLASSANAWMMQQLSPGSSSPFHQEVCGSTEAATGSKRQLVHSNQLVLSYLGKQCIDTVNFKQSFANWCQSHFDSIGQASRAQCANLNYIDNGKFELNIQLVSNRGKAYQNFVLPLPKPLPANLEFDSSKSIADGKLINLYSLEDATQDCDSNINNTWVSGIVPGSRCLKLEVVSGYSVSHPLLVDISLGYTGSEYRAPVTRRDAISVYAGVSNIVYPLNNDGVAKSADSKVIDASGRGSSNSLELLAIYPKKQSKQLYRYNLLPDGGLQLLVHPKFHGNFDIPYSAINAKGGIAMGTISVQVLAPQK